MTESDVILATIQHPAGFGIDLFGGMLRIWPTEHGTFEVEWDTDGSGEEKTGRAFTSAADAAAFFVAKRNELRLGFDHERGT